MFDTEIGSNGRIGALILLLISSTLVALASPLAIVLGALADRDRAVFAYSSPVVGVVGLIASWAFYQHQKYGNAIALCLLTLVTSAALVLSTA